MRVLIVGAGIAGLATAWALVRRGAEVEVFDRGPIPHPLAASNDSHRIIRPFYPDEPGYARMALDALPAWDELWGDLGEELLVPCGALALSRAPGDWADRARATLDRIGYAPEILSPAAVAERLPFLEMDGLRWGLFSPDGGALLADRILAALARWLRGRGVALHAERPVAAVEAEAGLLRLADGETVRGDRIVVAAGAWAAGLLPVPDLPLTPLRQCVVYAEPPAGHAAAWAEAPALVDLGHPDGHYAIPPVAGTGLKLAVSDHAAPGAPDANRLPAPGEPEAVLARFEGLLRRWPDYRVISARTCCYTMAPDSRFVAWPVGRAWLLSACSGHGFKFGALLGRAVAATLLGGRKPAGLTRWAAGLEEDLTWP